MILLFLACTSFVLVCPSWGGLTHTEFILRYGTTCFPREPALVNGQEYPLSQTLENFIALAEKLEVENTDMRIKEELLFFIRNYIFENIEYSPIGDIEPWKPNSAKELAYYWEPEVRVRDGDLRITVPYSEGENCSIFHMLSHSIIRSPRGEPVARAATNFSRAYHSDTNNYPMEIGVVAVRGTTAAVALGKVLTGMYIGLNPQRKRELPKEGGKDLPTGQEQVDPLYTLTIAETISLAKWRSEFGKRDEFAVNGEWEDVTEIREFETKDICPTIYKLPEGTRSSQSYSTLRGAADGLILGSVMQSITMDKEEVKLSEILRMYYSRGGITTKINPPDAQDNIQLSDVWASFCDRQNILKQFDENIRQQVEMYHRLVSSTDLNVVADTETAMSYYHSKSSEAYNLMSAGLSGYCGNGLSLEKVENLPLESPLDIIAVLDTRNGVGHFRSQQLILGHFMREMELSYYGSRMTILTDQKVTGSSSADSATVTLKTILEKTYSSPCAACRATQIVPDDTARATESEVIIGIDQLLQAKKDNETRRNGVKGKVVIYFNFREQPTTSRVNQEDVRVDRALRDLHLRHRDVEMYAIGQSKDLVKRYSKNDITFALAQNNPEDVAKELFKRVAKDAAILQYTDCEKATSESGAYYENLVSRNTIQHWFMPAKYNYKSKNWKFNFESTYGSIKVCYFQGYRSPEDQAANCKEGNKLEFENSNPCKGLTMESCSSFNFAIIGMNNSENGNSGNAVCRDTKDLKCKTMDQIKFRVTHDGIRCSGATGLTTSVFLLMGVFLLHIRNILSRH